MKTFKEILVERLEAENAPSAKTISDKADISYDIIKNLRQGKSKSTNVDDAIKIASAFGLTVNEFMNQGTESQLGSFNQLFVSLSADDQQLVLELIRRLSQNLGT